MQSQERRLNRQFASQNLLHLGFLADNEPLVLQLWHFIANDWFNSGSWQVKKLEGESQRAKQIKYKYIHSKNVNNAKNFSLSATKEQPFG